MPTTATFYEYTGPLIGGTGAGTQSTALSTLNFSAGTYADNNPIPITAGYCSLEKYISVIHSGVQPYSLSQGQYEITVSYTDSNTTLCAAFAGSYPTNGPSTNPLGNGLSPTGGLLGGGIYLYGTNGSAGSGSLYYNYANAPSTNGFGAAVWSILTYGAFSINYNIPYYAQPLVLQIVTNGSSTPGSYTLANLMSAAIVYVWSES
jgi:hypothetical protein